MRGEQQAAEKLYSATEVCGALKISRQTFDAWTLRGHLDLPKGPGTGRTRKLTFEQVVRVAALDMLTRQGIPIGSAADLLRGVQADFAAALRDHGGSGYVIMIEETKAQIGKFRLLQAWLQGWWMSDGIHEFRSIVEPGQSLFGEISEIGANDPPLGGWRKRRKTPIKPLPGQRSVFASMLHIGNLVARVRAALADV